MQRKELLKTAAEKMLQLSERNKEHEKRGQALRILYKNAELGYADVPRTYSELEEKIASLMTQDLNAVEKALEISVANGSPFGEVEKHAQKRLQPETEFAIAMISGDHNGVGNEF